MHMVRQADVVGAGNDRRALEVFMNKITSGGKWLPVWVWVWVEYGRANKQLWIFGS